MDPQANLKEQLELARDFVREADADESDVYFQQERVLRLAELVIALDEWMRKGGFSPWQKS